MEPTELPPNWRAARDGEDGKEYYFNELTGETSWTFPELDEKPKLAPETITSPPVAAVVPIAAADEAEFAPADGPPMVAPAGGNGAQHRFPSFHAPSAGAAGLMATLGEPALLPRVLILMCCSFMVMLQSSIYLGRTGTVPTGLYLAYGLVSCNVNATSDGGPESYGIAVGSISLGFCVLFLALAKYKPAIFSNWVMPKVRGELSVTQTFCGFMLAWWVPAALVLTFHAPFTTTSNAYFATWAALITVVLMAASSFQRVQVAMQSMSSLRDESNVSALAGLAISSAVVLFASFEYVGTYGEASFALFASMLSLASSAILYYLVDRNKVQPPVKKAGGASFVVLWFVAVLVLTFDEPFVGTSNGYFGTWSCMLCSLSFAYHEFVGGNLPLGSSLRRSLMFTPMEFDEAAPPVQPQGANMA